MQQQHGNGGAVFAESWVASTINIDTGCGDMAEVAALYWCRRRCHKGCNKGMVRAISGIPEAGGANWRRAHASECRGCPRG